MLLSNFEGFYMQVEITVMKYVQKLWQLSLIKFLDSYLTRQININLPLSECLQWSESSGHQNKDHLDNSFNDRGQRKIHSKQTELTWFTTELIRNDLNTNINT